MKRLRLVDIINALFILFTVATMARADEVTSWNETTVQAIRTSKSTASQAARALAMVHVAMYDAVNSIVDGGEKYHVFFETCDAEQRAAAAAAAHRVLVNLFPTQTATFDAKFKASCGTQSGQTQSSGSVKNGIALGEKVADAILDLRKSDGDASVSPGNLPFAMEKADQFRPVANPTFADFQYVAHFDDVKQVGAKDSRFRTADETQVARFWEDGVGTETTPGHWNTITRGLVGKKNSLFTNARTFALLNLAMADASVAVWDAKWKFNLWRPIAAIHGASTDAAIATAEDKSWEPLLETPASSSYIGDVAAYGAAAAAVLGEALDGCDSVKFTVTSDSLPGVKRTFRNFTDAAKEAGRSRVLGGVQFEFDNIAGLMTGKKIGDYVTCRYLNVY